MHSNKGVPNRVRAGTYRELVLGTGFESFSLEPSITADLAVVREARDQFAPAFRTLNDEELQCLAFWMSMKKRSPKTEAQ